MNYDDIDPALRNPTHGDLDFLADGYEADQKPPYSYTTIIKFSILGSPRGKLTLTELCETIQARFPYYTTTENDWRVRIFCRFSLSMFLISLSHDAELGSTYPFFVWLLPSTPSPCG
jgi:hypothetical protein